jgi:hypothetical protein
VGSGRLGEVAEDVVEPDCCGIEGSEPVGLSEGQFQLVVETLDGAG